jgi:hypothetical protein
MVFLLDPRSRNSYTDPDPEVELITDPDPIETFFVPNEKICCQISTM